MSTKGGEMDTFIEATSDCIMGEALFHAIEQGKVRSVSNMVESGCDINVRNVSMRTPLMQAVFVSKDDVRTYIVRMLLLNGGDVNAQDDGGRTVLMLAAFEPKRDDVIRRVISTGKCDPNSKDFKGNTALMHAVYGGNASVIRILVNSSHTKNIINVDCFNNDDMNPLILAFKMGQEECCKVLVTEGGADTSVIKDRKGFMYFLNRCNTQDPGAVISSEDDATNRMNDPFMNILASKSGNKIRNLDTDLKKAKHKHRSKKQSLRQQEDDLGHALSLNLDSSTQSTPRFNATSTSDNDSYIAIDSLRPHSRYNNSTRSRKLTPISALFEASNHLGLCPKTPNQTDTSERDSHPNWWPSSKEYDLKSPMEQLFQPIDEKGKARRRKKTNKARLSPLHTDYLKPRPLVENSGPTTYRGTLLPAIPRNVNLVGTSNVFEDREYQLGERSKPDM